MVFNWFVLGSFFLIFSFRINLRHILRRNMVCQIVTLKEDISKKRLKNFFGNFIDFFKTIKTINGTTSIVLSYIFKGSDRLCMVFELSM